jgi:FMN-binding domain
MRAVAIVLPATAVVSIASLVYQPGTEAPGPGELPGSVQPTSSQVVQGPVVTTDYGPVQVVITVAAGRFDQVAVPQYPTELAQSARINKAAIPQLRAASLAQQTAEVSSVSGATYTSRGFKSSLAGALHRAGLS